jgi:hypothetical protein
MKKKKYETLKQLNVKKYYENSNMKRRKFVEFKKL